MLREFLGPRGLTLAEVDPPAPSGTEVLIDVHAAGINRPDLLSTHGLHQHKLTLPGIPGSEVSGIISAVGPDSVWRVGQSVAAFVWGGGYAEQVVAPDHTVMTLPPGATHAQGAAMVVNYQTAHFALTRRGHARPGETVLVLGASGGVGSAAVQVANGLDCHVIIGLSDPNTLPMPVEDAACDVVQLTPGFSDAVRHLTAGRGVDLVVDPVGDWLFDEAVRTLAPEGRILVIGFAAGDIPQIKVNRLLLRNASVVGVAWGAFLEHDTALMCQAGHELQRLWQRGAIDPSITLTVNFSEIPHALELLAARTIRGKGVALVHPPQDTDHAR